MTRTVRATIPITLLLALVPVAGCNLEPGGSGDPAEGTQIDRVFSGYVVDDKGAALPGVTITSTDGELTTTSNSVGQFILLMPVFDGRASLDLKFEKEGYFANLTSIPIADETSHYTTLVSLSPVVETQVIDAELGGKLKFADGELIFEFGEAAFADAAGNTIEGEVEVSAHMIRPEDLKVEAMPVPSMLAYDPATPDQDALIASQGMFIMEAFQGDVQVWPAGGTTFRVVITGMERFIGDGLITPDAAIPLWTMDADASRWDFAGGWWVVEEVDDEGEIIARGAHGKQVAEDESPVGSDNTLYAIVTDIPVGATSGSPPPQVPRYNCDARPRLSCVRGTIDAEGLWYDDEIDDRQTDLETRPISGAYVGFEGIGDADNCNTCTCTETRAVEVCEDTDGDGDEECRNENQTVVSTNRPNNSGFGDVCATTGTQDACTCTQWTTISVRYQGGAYTDGNGDYCANVGAGGRITSAAVLKDWLITEVDPETGARSSYAVAYESHENPRLSGLRAGNMCEAGGSCGVYNHTMPCEWFWMNGACAVVGGCEVHHLRDFDEEDHISYYEDDEEYPY